MRVALMLLVGRDYLGLSTQLYSDAIAGNHIDWWDPLLKLLFTLMPRRTPALLRPLVRKVCNQALTTLVNPQLKQHMDYWEGELAKTEWFAGNEMTAADIQMSFPIEAADVRAGLGASGRPKLAAFLFRR